MPKATARSLAHKKKMLGGLFQYFLPHPSSVFCTTVYDMPQTLGIESWNYEKMAYEKSFTIWVKAGLLLALLLQDATGFFKK